MVQFHIDNKTGRNVSVVRSRSDNGNINIDVTVEPLDEGETASGPDNESDTPPTGMSEDDLED